MFLVDSAVAGADWDGVLAAIKRTLERAEAEIVSIRKWDERRLAYDIKGKARGTYILCYFKVDGQKIGDIENTVKLSEKIVRVLILNAEGMTEEDIEKDTPATKAEKEKEQRDTAKEAPKQDEAEQLSAQQEASTAEETEQAEETKTAEDTEQAEETKTAEDTEQVEETQTAEDIEQVREEQAEDSQESQPKTIADD
jgi:small subunit ribosomal protein S6